MYQLNGPSQHDTYSTWHIFQLMCVTITIAVWNNPEMKNQAKGNCRQKAPILHTLLNSSVDLKFIKKKTVTNNGCHGYDDIVLLCVNNFLVSTCSQVISNTDIMLKQRIYKWKIMKPSEKSFIFKLSANLNTFPVKKATRKTGKNNTQYIHSKCSCLVTLES
jgi:hypothetical protein